MSETTTDVSVSGPQPPIGLLCELLSHPEKTVITNPKPSFGGVVNDPRRGAVQRAYQIIVRTNGLDEATAIWDSGKVVLSESTNVAYGGEALKEGSYCWTVRTWDAEDTPSPWSKPQQFNIAEAAAGEAFYADQWTSIQGSDERVRANRHPLEVRAVPPRNVVRKAPGHYFVDFGRAAFGNLQLRLISDTGDHEVEIRLGEKLGADNTVETNPGGSVVYHKQSLILRKGEHTYRLQLPAWPRGVKMPEHIGEVTPFRYCEIINSPCEINEKHVSQLAVCYHFDDNASSFVS
jgi:hypothetical protein